jgi:hypothetical protein
MSLLRRFPPKHPVMAAQANWPALEPPMRCTLGQLGQGAHRGGGDCDKRQMCPADGGAMF